MWRRSPPAFSLRPETGVLAVGLDDHGLQGSSERVSKRVTTMPSTESSRTSHSERGPVSSPIRSIRVRSSPKQIAIDSGSVATTAYLVIVPFGRHDADGGRLRETSKAAKRGWFGRS